MLTGWSLVWQEHKVWRKQGCSGLAFNWGRKKGLQARDLAL